jgi:hypothetical protein
MFVPSFSKDTPNKIGDEIKVSGKNTLTKTDHWRWRAAIADEPMDAKVDGKKFFCVRVDNWGMYSGLIIGFTPMETFDSTKEAYFGGNGFAGCGMSLSTGNLCYPVDKHHVIIDKEITKKSKEIIVILTISNDGKKKEIQFLCDGNETKSTDVSEYLQGDRLFPSICLYDRNLQVETIPIDQIKTRTPEIENLIKEYQEQQQSKNQIPLLPSVSNEINNHVVSQLRQQINDDQRILIQEKDKQIQEMRKSYEEQLKHARLQMDEFRRDFLKQLEMKEKQNEESKKEFQKQLELKEKQNEQSRQDFLKQLEDSRRELKLEREISNKQLELERAENQQLRNLLQQQKLEMSAMEIYYLKRESGQRREREEEEFKVKEEPNEDEEEKPINNKKTSQAKKKSKK